MKRLLLTSAIILWTFSSCDDSRARDNQKPETPKALEDKTSSYSLDYKRSYEDLVESLYKELVSKDAALKELENKIDNLRDSRSDSTDSFSKFNGKSQSYYNAANNHADQMTDTLLKVKVKNMIAESLARYKSSVSQQNRLLDSIEVKNAALHDLHTILKVTKTLPLIEAYQKNNMPTTKPLEEYLKQQEEVIRFADTLSRK